jgi:hypothetical protein
VSLVLLLLLPAQPPSYLRPALRLVTHPQGLAEAGEAEWARKELQRGLRVHAGALLHLSPLACLRPRS